MHVALSDIWQMSDTFGESWTDIEIYANERGLKLFHPLSAEEQLVLVQFARQHGAS
jgi:hypothetical protein